MVFGMSAQEQDLLCLQRLKTGDAGALEELYDRYSSLLYPVALRILRSAPEAEDVLQEAWLQVWRSASTYDQRRGSIGAWLLMMTRSRALDRYRSLSSRKRAETTVEVDPPSPAEDPSAPPERRQLANRVRQALESLDPQHRKVLESAYFEGLSQSEIAERMKTPLGTVKSWTRQALTRLREILPQEEWV